MGSYILRVVSTGFLCAIVQLFFDKGSKAYSLVRLVCGMLLTLMVLSPIRNSSQWKWEMNVLEMFPDVSDVISEGEDAAKSAMGQIISQKTQTYILDKANALGADIDVEIVLSDETLPKPCKATIHGTTSPYVRKQLTQVICVDLGISEENQEWIY